MLARLDIDAATSYLQIVAGVPKLVDLRIHTIRLSEKPSSRKFTEYATLMISIGAVRAASALGTVFSQRQIPIIGNTLYVKRRLRERRNRDEWLFDSRVWTGTVRDLWVESFAHREWGTASLWLELALAGDAVSLLATSICTARFLTERPQYTTAPAFVLLAGICNILSVSARSLERRPVWNFGSFIGLSWHSLVVVPLLAIRPTADDSRRTVPRWTCATKINYPPWVYFLQVKQYTGMRLHRFASAVGIP